MILVEVEAAVDEFGTRETFYLGSSGFITEPGDTPANTVFLPRLQDPGSISLWAFAEGQTYGSTRLQPGEIKIINNDGAFDDWKDFSFEGQAVTIRSGDGGMYPGDFKVVFTGTVLSKQPTMGAITLNVSDKAGILDRAVLLETYLGTNVGTTGLEGVAGDLKGKVKPRVYGRVINISPPCVNTAKLIYQVSNRAVSAITDVYNGGEPWTSAGDYATAALLTAASLTPASATYATCLAGGLFRLSDSPDRQVTADVVAGSDDTLRTVAEILKQLALDAGIPEDDILASDVGELNALATMPVGINVDDDQTFRAAMDTIAQSAAAWWAFDPSGILRMGLLAEPSDTPDLDVIEADVLTGFEIGVADGSGSPVWRVTVRYSKNWTVQSTDLAGSVDDARRAELAQEYRTVSAEDVSVKIQWAQARELVIDTVIAAATPEASEAAALALAIRLLAIHKVRRDLFEVPIPEEVFPAEGISLMRTARLTHSRYGLSGGKAFLVLGQELDLARSRATLRLWG